MERSAYLFRRKTYHIMEIKKKIGLILTVLLSLSETVPAAATDHETIHERSVVARPPAPTSLVAEPGDGAATLRWNHPDNAPVDTWQYRQDTGDWQDMPHAVATRAYTIMDLTPGATYRFAVRAHNAAGWGLTSNTAVVTLNAAPRITGLESASFAEKGQGAVATYSARDGEGHSITWSLSGRDAGAFTFITDRDRHTMDLLFRAVPDYEYPSDVSPTDNAYQVMVVATDNGLPALATHYPVTVMVADVDEASPMPVMAEPERSGHTTQAEHVGWVVRSVVNYYKDVAGWALRGVINHVRDIWNASKHAKSDARALEQAGVPEVPTVSVYSGAWSAASGRVHVSVCKPTSNGLELTGYEYQLYQGEDRLLDWTSAGVDATMLAGLTLGASSSFSVGGLINGQPYAVAVRAVNDVGVSGSTQAMAIPGRILALERLQAVAGDGLVELKWAAAATEGPVITRYEWRGRPIWGAWSLWTPVEGGALARDHTVAGLENGIEYAFEVRAANPAGVGLVARVSARPEVAAPAPTGTATEPRGSDPL